MHPRRSAKCLAFMALALFLFGGCRSVGGSSPSDETQTTSTDRASDSEEDGDDSADEASSSSEASELPKSEGDTGSESSDMTADAPERSNDAQDSGSDRFDRLWAGRVYGDRVRIDLGAGDPYPDMDVSFDERDYKRVAPFVSGAIRKPYRGVSEVDVLTRRGPVRVAFDEVHRVKRGPSNDIEYLLITESSNVLKKAAPEVVVIAPAGAMAEGAAYREAETSRPDEESVPNLFDAVIQKLPPAARALVERGSIEALDPALREKLDYADSVGYDTEPGLDADHFEAVEGEFPGPRTHFVVANGREGIDGVGIEFDLVRATMFTAKDGRVTDVIDVTHGPRYKWGHAAPSRAKPLALVDLDADGTESVLYDLDESIRLVGFAGGSIVEYDLD